MPKLVRNVVVGKTWYGPAHGNADQVPADVADKIENPRAWDSPAEQPVEDGEREDLLARAEKAGIKVHANTKTETIRKRVEEAEAQT